ncbi:DUF6268 family outer membrane beta-barrel protein [Marinifilum sp. RC60d5]|uniref:DUF6268 family outer membrane beta-barrel protein n=1 Tax=Marinifilum sp. RC60d5 TaxID=3458414 RepID=UPI0040354705
MVKKVIVLFIVLLNICYITKAQLNKEKFGADYTFIGKGSSNKGGDVSFEKYDFRISFPKKLSKSRTLIFHKLEYAKTNIDYGTTLKTNNEIENFHSVSYTLGFSKPIKKDWFLTAFISPSIASNFESSINFDELNLFGMVLLSKPINKKKNLILSLGALYSNTLGFPAPIPVASLMWKANKKWTLSLGFPRFDINYKASKLTALGINLIMAGENFTLSKDIAYDNTNKKFDNIRIRNIGGALYLNQKISKMIMLKVNSGYTFSRNFEFNDGSDSVIDFDLDNNIYIKAGISIGI